MSLFIEATLFILTHDCPRLGWIACAVHLIIPLVHGTVDVVTTIVRRDISRLPFGGINQRIDNALAVEVDHGFLIFLLPKLGVPRTGRKNDLVRDQANLLPLTQHPSADNLIRLVNRPV